MLVTLPGACRLVDPEQGGSARGCLKHIVISQAEVPYESVASWLD